MKLTKPNMPAPRAGGGESDWAPLPGPVAPGYWERVQSAYGVPYVYRPGDYPLAIAAGEQSQTLLRIDAGLWAVVGLLTYTATAQGGESDPGEQTDLYPLRIGIRDAGDRTYALVPNLAPIEAVCARGQSIEGGLPHPGYALAPDTDWLITIQNDSSRDLNVYIAAHCYRRVMEG